MLTSSYSLPIQRRSEAEAAQHASSAFFNLAGAFFSKLPPDLDASARYCYDHRSEFIAATTNLALSVELSLKALAIATGAKVLKTHNLADLFEALHPKIRDSVELVYNRLLNQIPTNSPAAVHLYITNRAIPPTEEEARAATARYPKGHDIRSVLRAEKDAFVNWRYFYEAVGKDEIVGFKVEHLRMNAIKNALVAHFSDGKTKWGIPDSPRGPA